MCHRHIFHRDSDDQRGGRRGFAVGVEFWERVSMFAPSPKKKSKRSRLSVLIKCANTCGAMRLDSVASCQRS
jgi:hypothetical protein